MSHISTVKTTLTEAHYIVNALAGLGYTARVGRNLSFLTRFGDTAQADILFEYERQRPYIEPEKITVGFALSEDGEAYELVGDFWGWERQKDELLADITQQYGAQVAIEQLASMGFTETYQEVDADGSIRLVFNR